MAFLCKQGGLGLQRRHSGILLMAHRGPSGVLAASPDTSSILLLAGLGLCGLGLSVGTKHLSTAWRMSGKRPFTEMNFDVDTTFSYREICWRWPLPLGCKPSISSRRVCLHLPAKAKGPRGSSPHSPSPLLPEDTFGELPLLFC